MAAKKKTRKKSTRSKTSAARKVRPAKKRGQKRKATKKLAKKKAAPNKAKNKSLKKKTRGKTVSAPNKETRKKRPGRSEAAFSGEALGPGTGGQSGDLQGLTNVEGADSESVDELIEEGNAFEAGVVSGVEDADNADGGEVHTREVPEDDVPGEYLDED
jgi:hypothetical protein